MRGSPKKVKNEKADVDGKSMSPLCTYGRDEEYLDNKFWLTGAQTVILWGVGDGMIAWCALQKRIPIMCLYDRALHQKIIEEFLLKKIIEKMQNATPRDKRWYKTNEQLGCRAKDSKAAAAVAGTAKAVAAVKKVAAPKGTAPEKKNGIKNKAVSEDEGAESSSSSCSPSKAKKPKTSKAKTEANNTED